MKIALIPIYKTLEKNLIFKKNGARDNINTVYSELKNFFEQQNISLNTQDINSLKKSKYFIFFRLDWKVILQLFFMKKLKNSIYIQIEPPLVMQIHELKNLIKLSKIFGSILTWDDEAVGIRENIFKYYIPMPYNNYTGKIDFEKKKFLCNISGNKNSNYKNELYSERKKTIKYFEIKHEKEFDLYGVGWNKKEYKTYKGEIVSKNEILRNYKFSLCYENLCNINGYVTEKIFDCFYAKTIPIYWGSENIEEYVPKECYIDRRNFKTYEELYNFLKNMTKSEYEKRIEEIEKFLNSEKYKLFLPKNYYQLVYQTLMNTSKIKHKNYIAFFSIIQVILFLIYNKFYRKIKNYKS